MGLVKPDSNSFAKIKVLGIGGGGGNALNTMIAQNTISGVEFISVNTDMQALLANQSPTKLQIGEKLTKGLGSGADPNTGEHAAEESREKIREMLTDTDMIFITAGMGGGTGTGAAPVIAEIAKETGALTVAVVTKPFDFEGTRRMVQAEEGIEKLKDKVDTLIVIPNQKILEIIDNKTSLLDAFAMVDSVLAQGVQAISDLITVPGLINVDFADVKSIMTNAGSALMGTGKGMGEKRAQIAARAAITSPLLETSIDGARGILFNISGSKNMTMSEINEAAKIIKEAADPDASIIFGTTIRDEMRDEIKISVIATGFDESRRRLQGFVSRSSSPFIDHTPVPAEEYPREVPTPMPVPSLAETPAPKMDSKYQHTEVAIDDELDIPAFLRHK